MSNKNMQFLIIFFLLSIFYSCAENTKKIPPLKALAARENWFITKKRFTHYNYDNPSSKYLIHPFFDLQHYLTKKDQGVNMVVLTPIGNAYEYEIDLKSGRGYKKREYCKEDDIWGTFKGYIHKPPFTIGFVPRILDQRGLPQKIVTFGKRKYFPKEYKSFSSSVRVRIVGGVIEQYCPKYPCTLKNRWLSRVVLIAVNPQDPKFKNVVHIDELKKLVEWGEVRAFLENSNGRNISALKPLPSYRVIGSLGSNQSIEQVKNKGHLFDNEEIKSLQKNCYNLYDFLWSWSQTIRKNIKMAKKDRDDDLLDTTKEEFAGFMLTVSKQYKKRFMLCQRYTRAGSINDNIDRMWFFAYLNAYFSLESIGEVYSCKHRSWISNPYHVSGKRIFNPIRELEYCSTEDLNLAFYKIITKLAARQGSLQEFYRYIDYDNKYGGTHQKLYSWVYESSNHQSCMSKAKLKKDRVFPKNVDWKPF